MPALALGVVLAAAVAASSGCALMAQRCLEAQKRGPVLTLEGTIQPGQVISRVVPYDQQGSQNDLRIVWPGQKAEGGPRLRVFATSLECVDFVPPRDMDTWIPRGQSRRTDPRAPGCEELSSRGFTQGRGDELIQTGLSLTGGPSQRKPDFKAYKLHLVGDPHLESPYSIVITWFFGPDC